MNKTLIYWALAASLAGAGPALAQKKYDPGVTDTEIKIGQTMPYSGPASAYGSIGKTTVGYFKMLNEQGGVNGRKINLISLDDGYSPPKTIEATRRLVEQEEVLLVFGSVGTPTNSAVHRYMNMKKVPQLFVTTGASKWDDPKNFPWTMGWAPSYQLEGRIFAEHILRSKPDAKVAILWQNDDFGKDYLKGVRDRLGDKYKSMVVAEASFEVTDATVDSQILTLKNSGADVFINAATPKFAAQAIRRVYDIGWRPALQYVTSVSSTVGSVLEPAGLDRATGVMTTQYMKDPADRQWDTDPAMIEYKAFMKKYCPDLDPNDHLNVQGYAEAITLVDVFKRAGDNLTRENIMRQAASIKDLRIGVVLPGMTLSTGPDDFRPLSSLTMSRFDGKAWKTFGEPIADRR
jgi:branched-chain amino acid transport system substrate-binding protein